MKNAPDLPTCPAQGSSSSSWVLPIFNKLKVLVGDGNVHGWQNKRLYRCAKQMWRKNTDKPVVQWDKNLGTQASVIRNRVEKRWTHLLRCLAPYGLNIENPKEYTTKKWYPLGALQHWPITQGHMCEHSATHQFKNIYINRVWHICVSRLPSTVRS